MFINEDEVFTICERLSNMGFSGSVKIDYVKPHSVTFTISKYGVEVSDTWSDEVSPDSFFRRITYLWEHAYISSNTSSKYNVGVSCTTTYSQPTYIVKNGYGIYKVNPRAIPEIENVIFNGPATIVIWKDGTKTVVKCDKGDIFDPEKGLAMAISKRALGNKGNYCDEFKKWTKDLPYPDSAVSTDAYMAYHRLVNALHDKKATKADLGAAMEEAVGYLGHLLDH